MRAFLIAVRLAVAPLQVGKFAVLLHLYCPEPRCCVCYEHICQNFINDNGATHLHCMEFTTNDCVEGSFIESIFPSSFYMDDLQ